MKDANLVKWNLMKQGLIVHSLNLLRSKHQDEWLEFISDSFEDHNVLSSLNVLQKKEFILRLEDDTASDCAKKMIEILGDNKKK